MKNFKSAGAFVLLLAASFAGGAVSNFWIAPEGGGCPGRRSDECQSAG